MHSFAFFSIFSILFTQQIVCPVVILLHFGECIHSKIEKFLFFSHRYKKTFIIKQKNESPFSPLALLSSSSSSYLLLFLCLCLPFDLRIESKRKEKLQKKNCTMIMIVLTVANDNVKWLHRISKPFLVHYFPSYISYILLFVSIFLPPFLQFSFKFTIHLCELSVCDSRPWLILSTISIKIFKVDEEEKNVNFFF